MGEVTGDLERHSQSANIVEGPGNPGDELVMDTVGFAFRLAVSWPP